MKNSLMEQFLKKRKELTKSKLITNSRQIKQLLFSTTWYRSASKILFYVSFNNEVSTHEMIKDALLNGKTVLVPKCDTEKNTLCISHLIHWADLEKGAYSILEPRQDCLRPVPVSSVDLIIVPGVVFDTKGNRIGYGKGFYDRLLQEAKNAYSIGLAFESQIIESIPSEEHDEKVDIIITEDRIIQPQIIT